MTPIMSDFPERMECNSKSIDNADDRVLPPALPATANVLGPSPPDTGPSPPDTDPAMTMDSNLDAPKILVERNSNMTPSGNFLQAVEGSDRPSELHNSPDLSRNVEYYKRNPPPNFNNQNRDPN